MDSLKSDNTGLHMSKIIEAVGCSRHASDLGEACWNIPSTRGNLRAICDNRARSAGARGQITPYKRSDSRPDSTNQKDYR